MVGLGIAPDVIPRVQRILYISTNYDRTRKGIFTLPVGNQQSGTLLLVANRPSPLVAEGRLNKGYWSHIFIDRSLNFYDDAQCPRCFLIAMLSFTGITSVLPISICSRSKVDTAAKSLASMMAHDL